LGKNFPKRPRQGRAFPEDLCKTEGRNPGDPDQTEGGIQEKPVGKRQQAPITELTEGQESIANDSTAFMKVVGKKENSPQAQSLSKEERGRKGYCPNSQKGKP
jgi:hypothetical protein